VTAPTIEIPAGARVPIGNPPLWLAAADRAAWQCQCTTDEPKSVCGKSHRKDEGGRCPRRAAGSVAILLVLVPDGAGSYRLMCQPCAPGNARAAAAAAAAMTFAPTDSAEQLSLF
jgi:hypothetical protein